MRKDKTDKLIGKMLETDIRKAERIGSKLIDILGLKVKANGRVDTLWGDKTTVGLARTVARILEEN